MVLGLVDLCCLQTARGLPQKWRIKLLQLGDSLTLLSSQARDHFSGILLLLCFPKALVWDWKLILKFGKLSSEIATSAGLIHKCRLGSTGPFLPIGVNHAVLEDNGSQKIMPATRTLCWNTVSKLQFPSFCIITLFLVTTENRPITTNSQHPRAGAKKGKERMQSTPDCRRAHPREKAETGSTLGAAGNLHSRCLSRLCPSILCVWFSGSKGLNKETEATSTSSLPRASPRLRRP